MKLYSYRHWLALPNARWKKKKKDTLVRLITQYHRLHVVFKLRFKSFFSRDFTFPYPYGCDTA